MDPRHGGTVRLPILSINDRGQALRNQGFAGGNPRCQPWRRRASTHHPEAEKSVAAILDQRAKGIAVAP